MLNLINLQRNISKLFAICFFLLSISSYANDNFNPVNGQVTIPSVSVGSTVYTNVVITVGQVLSVGTAPAIGPNDTYNSSNGTLKIPIVNVSGQLYYNVVVTLGSVINVGPSSSQKFSIGGYFIGLNSGQTLVLSNNANDTFNIVGGYISMLLIPGSDFLFGSPVPYNGNYAVTIKSQPVGQTCKVDNGTGFNLKNNVTNIVVTCSGAQLTIGGTISGLPAGQSVRLLLNEVVSSALTLSQAEKKDIPFTFFDTIQSGARYLVTVGTQPTDSTCTVSNGFGDGVTANITNIAVVCSANSQTPITIGGAIGGFNGEMILLNNGGYPLYISDFSARTAYSPKLPTLFSFPMSYGGSYSVSIGAQPSDQNCWVSNGSGSNVTSSVTNITVSCSQSIYTIGGTLSGLTTGQKVTLLLNGSNSLILTKEGNFTFLAGNVPLPFGSGEYSVTIGTQPLGQNCTVTNGFGITYQSNISNVSVSCTSN